MMVQLVATGLGIEQISHDYEKFTAQMQSRHGKAHQKKLERPWSWQVTHLGGDRRRFWK